MKRFFSLACLMLALQPHMVSAQRQQYEINAKILNFAKGQVRIASEKMQLDASSPTNILVASAPSALEITIDSNRPPVTLRFQDGELDISSLPKDILLQAAPRVTTIANQPARIQISQAPQYFEKRDDGTFQLHQMSESNWVGFAAQFLVTPQNIGGDIVVVDSSLEVNWIQDRELITNVFMDVGRPTIVRQTAQTSLTQRTGQWTAVLAPGSFGGPNRSTLFLFRVRRVNERGESLDK
jgi:hypothetical protein